jgi:hypothetical protein
VLPQFQRSTSAETFVEALLLSVVLAIWLKMAWPLLPFNCTGDVASQIKAKVRRIKPNITRFLISHLIFIVSELVLSNFDEYKDVVLTFGGTEQRCL